MIHIYIQLVHLLLKVPLAFIRLLLGRHLFSVELHKELLEQDFLFDIFHSDTQYLPMLPGMRHAKDLFKEPVQVLTPRVDKNTKWLNLTPSLSGDCFHQTQLLRLLVRGQTCFWGLFTSWEGKQVHRWGWEGGVTAQAATHWHIANSQAFLARYNGTHWDEMEELLQNLPREYCKRPTDCNRRADNYQQFHPLCPRCSRSSS